MPTLSEFIMTIGLRHLEADTTTQTYFRFETVREFQSFRYQVEVDDALDPGTRTIRFNIKGVRAPVGLMSSSGSAITEVCYPLSEGEYTVLVTGAKQSGSFRFKRRPQGIKLIETEGEDFIRLNVIDKIELIRA